MNVGLFIAARATPPTIASTVTLAETTGHSVAERGRAKYRVDSSVPTGTDTTSVQKRDAYLARYPLSSFQDASNRVFRIDEREVTPYMFGAVGDGTTDDSDAIQAFFDDAFVDRYYNDLDSDGDIDQIVDDAAQLKRVASNYYNMDGTFGVKRQIFAVYHPPQELTRRFRGGRLSVLALAQNELPLENVLTIAGYRQTWEGELAVLQENVGNVAYIYRRFRNGVKMLSCSQSVFETIRVDGARGDAVNMDSSVGLWTERAGTPFAVSLDTRSNIGLRIGDLVGRYCGSCAQSSSSGYRYNVAIQSITQGGDPYENPAVVNFQAGTGFNGSLSQRSRLKLADNRELRVLDVGRVRLELNKDVYGTIATDNAAKTLTWSQGDALASGLQVGEKIIPQSGANAGKLFTITAITGTPARTIQVDPAPTQEAAAELSGLFSDFSTHVILNHETVNPGTNAEYYIDVYPHVPTRTNSQWHSMHGWLASIKGGDSANIHIDYVSGRTCGGGLLSAGLYGPNVRSLKTDHAEVAVMQGATPGAVQLGTVIEHIHAEATSFNLIQLTSAVNTRMIIKGGSNFYLPAVLPLYVRANPTDALAVVRPLTGTTIDLGGDVMQTVTGGAYSGATSVAGDSAVSNSPNQRLRTVIGDSGSVEIAFRDDVARLFAEHHWAEVTWIGSAGGAPTGTLTFNMATALSALGWTFAGSNSVTAPSAPCVFRIRFHKPTKKVIVTRFNAA